MCGITGIFSDTQVIDIDRYYAAHSRQRHRGPDDEGFVTLQRDGSCRRYIGEGTCEELRRTAPDIRQQHDAIGVLGHHRLSILDVSPAGHQPMIYEALQLVYNGEIYNYRELREELVTLGYVFESQTDSEVVLKALHCWGPAAFNRFNGMWALAVWNSREKRLLLSRDRFGIKPLYYAKVAGQFLFASEMKFFRSMLDLTPNEKLMREFVEASRLDHEAETMLDPVRQLMPGQYAEFDLANSDLHVTSYWSLKHDRQESYSQEEAVDQFQRLFDSAIELRLRSDVPVGALLSGGLDSSAIVSNMAWRGLIGEGGLQAFSAVFPDWDQSEHGLIDETIQRYPQINAHQVVPTPERLMADLPKLLDALDFPIRSSAAHSQYMLYEHIRQNSDIVVLLNGQGADECFAGYTAHRLPRIAAALQRLQLADAWTESSALSDSRHQGAFSVIRAAFGSLLRHARYRYLPGATIRMPANYSANPLTGILAFNLGYASLPEYLRYEDRNSMHVACEARLPFLDYRLVEWAFRLPDQLKIRNGRTKYVQRRAVSAYVPEAIVENRIKKGFISPQQAWQKSVMREWLRERVADHGVSFLPRNLIDSFDANPDRDYSKWWRVACLAEWLNVR